MTTVPSEDLSQLPADRGLVEKLYAHGLLTPAARVSALEYLYPHSAWGLWAARLLLLIGSALILAGIVYFFAFNWTRIPPWTKFTLIEGGLLACVAGAWFLGLKNLGGKLSLLAAAVLTGVFLAVFSQVYQTGADAYQLFMMWALLISGWVIIGEFAALWAVWLVVTNVFLILYWLQNPLFSRDNEFLLFSWLALLNGVALLAKEWIFRRGIAWLEARWLRVLLTWAVLVSVLVPTLALIAEPEELDTALALGTGLGVVAHGTLWWYFRYQRLDLWVLASTVLSLCLIAETTAYQVGDNMLYLEEIILLPLLGIVTLAIFTIGFMVLQRIHQQETAHD